MKKYLILFLIFVSNTLIASDSKLKLDFLNKTHMRLGDYELIAPSHPNCLQGSLHIVDLKDRITLMLGQKPLAQEIGRGKFIEKDGDCQMSYDTSYNETEINDIRGRICKANSLFIKTKIKFFEDKLSYTTVTNKDGKIIDEFDCDLKLYKAFDH